MSQIDTKQKISDIVSDNLKAADVFEKYNIDFCCGGNITIDEACRERGLDSKQLVTELEKSMNGDADAQYIQSLNSAELADYIEQNHHTYVTENIPVLQQYLEKVCSVHGDNHPELHKIRQLFEESAGVLTQHMKKEELILFPFIRKLETARQNGSTPEKPHFGHVTHPITMMREEHANEGARFEEIDSLSESYNPPPDACNTFRVLYHKLYKFEKDLHRHIHLENNILFPNAEKMYQSFFGE
ncbi:MAG: iron-sulfur cluster repair di-iron protein [Bacteroidales bacterium]|nr:iron-sulfur cluster repair di-iron protein [Bacteroidales bacterium]MCF8337422.1 iron-sulfur cluster repair di-iron protein [Bacteroidales bacterium]